MTQQVQQFAEAAELFCAWVESSPSAANVEAETALKHLSTLYRFALELPEGLGEEEPGDIPYEAWFAVYQRFAALPFNYYAQCFDPFEIPAEAVTADLADDLADTWRDLKRGLLLFKAGHVDSAVWEWRESFWQHWGQHAAGGIYALHAWYSRHGEDSR